MKLGDKKGKEDPTSIIFLDNPKPDLPKSRMIGLFGDVDEEKTSDVVHGMLLLRDCGKEEIHEDPLDSTSEIKETIYKPIDFYISTWGGDARGMFAIYDVMRMVRENYTINTYGLGKVMSAGVLLLAAGTKGKRGGLFHADGYDTAPWVNEYGYPTGGIPIKKGG